MKTFKKFEEINAWQKARELNKKTYELTLLNQAFNNDYGLKDQIRRSCISISSNIAEGFERETFKEFIRFLYISKASAGEYRSQLYLAYDVSYISKYEFQELNDIVNEISKMLFGLIKYLKTKLSNV